MVLALALLFVGCGQEPQLNPNPNPESSAEVPSASSTAEPGSVPEQPVSSSAAGPSAELQKVVYKEEEYLLWLPTEEDNGQSAAHTALRRIHEVRYGEAGASLDMTGAAALMLKDLAEDPEFETALEDYLRDLTPLQRDYFSFQWRSVYSTAARMLKNPANYQPFLGDVGREDLELSSCDPEKLEQLNELVHTTLSSHGVCDSWKDYTDLEPFCLGAEA